MNTIYIILYSEFELADCYSTYSDGVYYKNKDEAINHLETNRYKHIRDDEYKKGYNERAEILQLDNRSDGE
ncbi:hypothetical protein HpBTM60_04550 [Helicobacter pylori]